MNPRHVLRSVADVQRAALKTDCYIAVDSKGARFRCWLLETRDGREWWTSRYLGGDEVMIGCWSLIPEYLPGPADV